MKKAYPLFVIVIMTLALSSPALANKTSVSVLGPDAVAAGTEVTLTISVSHKGNSVFHHTNWVVVKADGQEIARWDFPSKNLPEAADFKREVKYAVAKAVEITAQGHCNIHGSRDPIIFKIGIR